MKLGIIHIYYANRLDRFSIMDESEISRIVVLQNLKGSLRGGLKDMRSHLYNDKDSCQIE